MNPNASFEAMMHQARLRAAGADVAMKAESPTGPVPLVANSDLPSTPADDDAAALAAAGAAATKKGLEWTGIAGAPAVGSDSLLGMAASLFGVDHAALPPSAAARPMMMPDPQTAMLTPQQQLARSVDITSQVLSELPPDMFDEAFGNDLFEQSELEPLPLDPRRMNVIQSSRDMMQRQNHQSSLAVLEETLNVLNQDMELDMFHQAQGFAARQHAAAAAAAQAAAMNMNVNAGAADAIAMPHGMVAAAAARPSNKRTVSSASPKRSSKKQRTSNGASPAGKNAAVGEAEIATTAEDDQRRFRPYQSEQWAEKFEELLAFKKERGHCCVPHTFEENPALARWVKRQRYQYKLKNECKQSTMTDDRVKTLENVGFIWDSHSAAWFDRLNELGDYKKGHGNCNVPSNYPANPQLATWVKCQRRQYKLFWDGKTSNMTLERISELEKLGFEWELRSHNKNKNKVAAARHQTLRQHQQRQQLQQQQQHHQQQQQLHQQLILQHQQQQQQQNLLLLARHQQSL
eukprot:CAMPEP_0198113574 /NCGR_PEP_ID=MMETSP1442-20131203/5207_1 /TAXON_ID= /ORGANISM="Craspedostauros australis, Strain CCMP3328" /LENGTH=517 /DNA_ID=CAMNT_0043770703 /DNA_START=186 /DNA_END=1739 /DNA_ORIENTATION=-